MVYWMHVVWPMVLALGVLIIRVFGRHAVPREMAGIAPGSREKSSPRLRSRKGPVVPEPNSIPPLSCFLKNKRLICLQIHAF